MNRYSIFFLFVILIFSTDVFCQVCEQVQTCEELDFKYYENDCDRIDLPFIKCPFDNSKVYCPEDCSSYTLDSDSCDTNIGTCSEPCPGNGKVKYTSCTNGYMLSEGKCSYNDKCVEEGFTSDEKDPTIGEIEYCWNNEERLSRYKSCKEGWQLTYDKGPTCSPDPCDTDDYKKLDKTCTDTEFKEGSCIRTCPHNADCSSKVCYTGTTKKVKITCNDGLFLQQAVDAGFGTARDEGVSAEERFETYKCRKHKIGNIAFYCKTKGKISELATELANETSNTSYKLIDDNDDQIISLEPEYYDKAIGYECEAIGVVFDNDTKTKIVALKDIKYVSEKEDFQEQISTEDLMATSWGNISKFITELTPMYFSNANAGGWRTTDIDGAVNTDVIIAWANLKKDSICDGTNKCTAPAAQATKVYYPRSYSGSTYKKICPETSACGKGKWYLPSGLELMQIKRRKFNDNKFVKAFAEIEEKNSTDNGGVYVGFSLYFKYFFSTPNNPGQSAPALVLSNTNTNFYNCYSDSTVRPVLVID